MPVFESNPFGSPREAEAAAFVGRVESAFSSTMGHYDEVQTSCKEIVTKSFSQSRIIPGSSPGSKPGDRDGAGACRVGYQGQYPIACKPPSRDGLKELPLIAGSMRGKSGSRGPGGKACPLSRS
jgi:hypothetical protein